ncbi:MAG: DUF2155 domain-containing protein [Alphaproteobacteria bacterium]|nr:DUF2155 domain-containing protein [Alphaproteobacteria bacterium]
MKKILFLSLFLATVVQAKDIPTTTAVLRTMDKITGRVQKVEASIGEEIQVGSLSVHLEKCLKKPPEETPENAAFLTIIDQDTPESPVFRGWMFSSNPALSAMEHPVYDIWVVECGEEIINQQILPDEELPPIVLPEIMESDEPIED